MKLWTLASIGPRWLISGTMLEHNHQHALSPSIRKPAFALAKHMSMEYIFEQLFSQLIEPVRQPLVRVCVSVNHVTTFPPITTYVQSMSVVQPVTLAIWVVAGWTRRHFQG